MKHRRLGAVLTALTLTLGIAACGGGGDSAGSDPTKATPKPLTLADFKTSPDQVSATIEAPEDLGVPASWKGLADRLTSSLEGMLTTSFTDSNVWMSRQDERTYALVFDKFTAVEGKGLALGKLVYEKASKNPDNPGRFGYKVGSTFPSDAQPKDAFLYKVAWTAGVDGDKLSVRGIVWAGYDVGGDQPVMVARDMQLTATRTGGDAVDYSASTPAWGSYAATCPAVVDGVLEPADNRIAADAIKAFQAEFSDASYHPLVTAFPAIAKAGGDDMSEAASREIAEKCVADAEKAPSS